MRGVIHGCRRGTGEGGEDVRRLHLLSFSASVLPEGEHRNAQDAGREAAP